MGHDAKVKADRIHRRKLFDGRTTAQELWRQTVIGERKCMHCQVMRAIGTINMFWPAKDFEKDQPALAVKIASEHQGGIPFVSFKSAGGIKRNFVHMPTLYACGHCARELEKMLAKAPSYVVVEIRRGPGEDKPQVQVS